MINYSIVMRSVNANLLEINQATAEAALLVAEPRVTRALPAVTPERVQARPTQVPATAIARM